MPNPARASFDIELNGETYTLRPTFESIMEFNDKAGLDIFQAMQKFREDKGLSVKTIVASIWAGIRGEEIFQRSGNTSFERIGQHCQEHGLLECTTIAMEYLARAVASDDRLKKLNAES
jgi:hypothetical protein